MSFAEYATSCADLESTEELAYQLSEYEFHKYQMQKSLEDALSHMERMNYHLQEMQKPQKLKW
jgi:hypothetical protein